MNGTEQQRPPPKAHLVEISVVSMHQNGRDTHVRLVQLYGPKRLAQQKAELDREQEDFSLQAPVFSTLPLSQFSCIR